MPACRPLFPTAQVEEGTNLPETGLRDFGCVVRPRSKRGLVVKVTYMHFCVVTSCVLLLVFEPKLGTAFAPFLLVSSFPFLLINLIQCSAPVSSAGLCGVKPPPDPTWSGRRCQPGQLLTCELAKCGTGDGRGPTGAARPGWPGRRELCARWG